jgi:hypothetical protein
MALELICDASIEPDKRIAVPRMGNSKGILIYQVVSDEKNPDIKKIEFYEADEKEAEKFTLNRWRVAPNARKMEFMFYKYNGDCFIGPPAFYDANGNLLKIGNR